ncbi:MAG: hypothetical protein HQL11_05525 [Candidatus Omnitrophica bacterium]|nr:hypothetical protein [Candidatus Omnitrophota bacterium]
MELRLTPEAFERIQSDPKSCAPERIAGFLNGQILRLGNFEEKAIFEEPSLPGAAREALEFYRLARRRDERFAAEVLEKIVRDGEQSLGLIAGGVHAPFHGAANLVCERAAAGAPRN